MEDCMLTTVDNPYSPFDQFKEWYAFDMAHGYNTCGYLARMAPTSFEMPEAEQNSTIQAAIDEIVRYNWMGIHRKCVRSDYPNVKSTIDQS